MREHCPLSTWLAGGHWSFGLIATSAPDRQHASVQVVVVVSLPPALLHVFVSVVNAGPDGGYRPPVFEPDCQHNQWIEWEGEDQRNDRE